MLSIWIKSRKKNENGQLKGRIKVCLGLSGPLKSPLSFDWIIADRSGRPLASSWCPDAKRRHNGDDGGIANLTGSLTFLTTVPIKDLIGW